MKDKETIEKETYNYLSEINCINCIKADICAKNMGGVDLHMSGIDCPDFVSNKNSINITQKVIAKIKQALNRVETIVSDNNMNTLQPNIGYNMKQVDDLLDEIEKQIIDAKNKIEG